MGLKTAIAAACCFVLGGCAYQNLAPPAATELKADPLVGSIRWVDAKHRISLCDTPFSYASPSGPRHCETLPGGTRLTIERAIFETTSLGVQIDNGYWVRDAKDRGGYIGSSDTIWLQSEAVKKEEDRAKADCDRRGGVAIGMTKAQVYSSCWGRPRKVNETMTARSRHEQWVYGGGYVYLEDGVVTSIQTSR